MAIFIEVKGLLELERAEKWEEARAMLYELWNADRENIDLFLRLFSECWYVLCEWNAVVDAEGLSWETFQDTLVECTMYGLDHFGGDTRFLWMGGYMIRLFPYLFYRAKGLEQQDWEALYLKWESKSNEMSEKAARQEPNNLLAKFHFVGSYQFVTANGEDEYLETTKQLVPLLGKYFPGDTAIEEYFRDI